MTLLVLGERESDCPFEVHREFPKVFLVKRDFSSPLRRGTAALVMAVDRAVGADGKLPFRKNGIELHSIEICAEEVELLRTTLLRAAC